jgi:segregation and condensation protein B
MPPESSNDPLEVSGRAADSANADGTEALIPPGEPDAGIEEAYQKALCAVQEYDWADGFPGAAPAENVAATLEPGDQPPQTAASAARLGALEAEDAAMLAYAMPAVPGTLAGIGTPPLPRAPTPQQDATASVPAVEPAQVIEAALFVGGIALGPKQLASLLRGSLDADAIAALIERMNAAYTEQGRPYEIRFRGGGYQLALRPEYERLRQRVYGAGPREVKLSPDVLEVLALVAYRQPITQKEIEAAGKPNAGNLLRQLLRRDLIRLDRGAAGQRGMEVRYSTTERFLSVFGLARLEDLPTPDDLELK